jgi:viroplasmin and RNaseH domain-containing protein
MAASKFYAIVFPSGKSHIHEAAWEKVEPLVKGVSGVKYKGFTTRAAAEEWVITAIKEVEKAAKAAKMKPEVKKIEDKHAISRSDWMSANVNTPHWNAIRRNKKRISEG